MTGLPAGARLEVVYDAREATRTLLLYVPGRGALVLGTATDMQQVLEREWAATIDWDAIRAAHPHMWEPHPPGLAERAAEFGGGVVRYRGGE